MGQRLQFFQSPLYRELLAARVSSLIRLAKSAKAEAVRSSRLKQAVLAGSSLAPDYSKLLAEVAMARSLSSIALCRLSSE